MHRYRDADSCAERPGCPRVPHDWQGSTSGKALSIADRSANSLESIVLQFVGCCLCSVAPLRPGAAFHNQLAIVDFRLFDVPVIVTAVLNFQRRKQAMIPEHVDPASGKTLHGAVTLGDDNGLFHSLAGEISIGDRHDEFETRIVGVVRAVPHPDLHADTVCVIRSVQEVEFANLSSP